MTVTLTYAKSHWNEILTAVEGGQTVTLTRAGKPVAYLSNRLPPAIQADQIARLIASPEIETGVMRPAPAAAGAFPDRGERKSAAELANPPARISGAQRSPPPPVVDSQADKKTAPSPVSAPAPVSRPKLTLADVLRAASES